MLLAFFCQESGKNGSESVSGYAIMQASGLRQSRFRTMSLLTLITSGLPVIRPQSTEKVTAKKHAKLTRAKKIGSQVSEIPRRFPA
jgi:hypothetical protein